MKKTQPMCIGQKKIRDRHRHKKTQMEKDLRHWELVLLIHGLMDNMRKPC